jgi:hypothetical protein
MQSLPVRGRLRRVWAADSASARCNPSHDISEMFASPVRSTNHPVSSYFADLLQHPYSAPRARSRRSIRFKSDSRGPQPCLRAGTPQPSSHHEVDRLATPLRQAGGCDLRRFHQQKAHHRTPLLCPSRRRFQRFRYSAAVLAAYFSPLPPAVGRARLT